MERISNILIEFFGSANNLIEIIILTLLTITIGSFLQFKRRIIYSIISTTFIVLQIVSLYFTHSFIGYQFYIHFNTRDLSGLTYLYSFHIIITLILTFCLFITHRWVGEKLCETKKLIRFSLILSLVSFIIYSNQFITDTKTFLITLQTDKKDFKEAIQKLGIKDYTHKKDLKGIVGKNIIIFH